MPGHAVVNSNGRASISTVDPNTNRALVFRDDGQGDPICEECCDCRERCQANTRGFGCVLSPEGDEVGSVVMAGSSSGVIHDRECEDIGVGVRWKGTTLGGNGSMIQLPSGNGFRCGQTNYAPPNLGVIYSPGTPPDFCGDCVECPSPSEPRALQGGVVHDMELETNTIAVEPGGCSGDDGAPSDNYVCFGELEGVDSATIPEAQFIAAGFVDIHTNMVDGDCFGVCRGLSWHLITFNLQVVFSPVTDRFAGRIFSPVTGVSVGAFGDEEGSVELSSLVAIIRGGFVGLRYEASATSLATLFGSTRTRTGSVNATVNFPHWGVCCTDGSRRSEEVTLVGPGGAGAAFAHDPIFHRAAPIVVRRPRRKRRRGCGAGCRDGSVTLPTASEVKRIAESRVR